MNLHIHITAPFKRLRQAVPLPVVECTEMEARNWFAGLWHGLPLGIVIGAGAVTVLLA